MGASVWLVLLLLGLSKGEQFSCQNFQEPCQCLKVNFNDIEMQCPENDTQYMMEYSNSGYVKVQCWVNNITDLYLPEISLGEIKKLYWHYCPVPRGGFPELLKRWNITLTDTLKIIGEDVQNPLTKEQFLGMERLKNLEIRNLINESSTEPDFLAHVTELKQISLRQNFLPNLKIEFNYSQKLNYLDLSESKILNIPDYKFKDLENLIRLELWTNGISTLKKNTFYGLKNLLYLELSNNNISVIEKGALASMPLLRNVSFRINQLKLISDSFFEGNPLIERVILGDNPELKIEDNAFASLPKLKYLTLSRCKLTSLKNWFHNSSSILELEFQVNEIKQIQNNTFTNLKNLEKLDLSFNLIEDLEEELFFSNKNLKKLILKHNSIKRIKRKLFEKLTKLEELDLSHNNIKEIEESSMYFLTELRHVYLSHNLITLSSDKVQPFSQCKNLETFDASYNLIETFPDEFLNTKTLIKTLNLTYNKIQTLLLSSFKTLTPHQVLIDLSHNKIKYVEFDIFPRFEALDTPTSKIILNENPIRCDCKNFDLVNFLQGEINPVWYSLYHIEMENKCSVPEQYSHFNVKEIKPSMVVCEMKQLFNNYPLCPEKCGCFWKPFDTSYIVDCAERNLTQLPNITSPLEFNGHNDFFFNQSKIYLQKNGLKMIEDKLESWENVTEIDLSFNHITNLTVLPPNVEVIQLHNNSLGTLGKGVLNQLNFSSVQSITLSGNPWKCDCSAKGFANFLRNNYKKVQIDMESVRCNRNGKPLHTIQDDELCTEYKEVILIATLSLLIPLFFVATVFALYYRYNREIKVWLFAKNLCLWFVAEEDLDKDKQYDIFISYASNEEKFVNEDLLPILEYGPNAYKVCNHLRDFNPGEFIITQVEESIKKSKRTLVILTNDFLKSEWCKLEFKTAHSHAIQEGRTRVIAIIYGDFDESKVEDADIKAYLRTNTYIKWGDPWFWNKLRYALPHSKKINFIQNQRHANVMLKIDDKFNLIKSPPTPNVGTTPPIILDVGYPFSVQKSDVFTPPAEDGALVKA